jgi:hypothetical protein
VKIAIGKLGGLDLFLKTAAHGILRKRPVIEIPHR